MAALHPIRNRWIRVLPILILSFVAGCDSDSAGVNPAAPADPSPVLRVPTPLGSIDVLAHGMDEGGRWIRFQRGGAVRELDFGRRRLAGGAVQASLEIRQDGVGLVGLEVLPGPDPDDFVPRAWVLEDGRRQQLELDPVPQMALPPRVLLPRRVEGPLREAAYLLSSEEVQRELFGSTIGAKPSSLLGYDCVEAWTQMFRTCVDVRYVHECEAWVAKVLTCILIALVFP